MRTASFFSAALAAAVPLLAVTFSLPAAAQSAPTPPPPPGFEVAPPAPLPPGYGAPPGYGTPPPGYAPPGYAPPPGYSMPPGARVGPKTMDYEEGAPIPPGYHLETRMRKGFVIGGAATFGVFYLVSVLTGLIGEVGHDVTVGSKQNDFAPMYIPLAGPFITIKTANADTTGGFGLGIIGVAQAAGATLLIAGLAAPATKLVRDDVSRPRLRVLPTLAKGTLGLSVVGSL